MPYDYAWQIFKIVKDGYTFYLGGKYMKLISLLQESENHGLCPWMKRTIKTGEAVQSVTNTTGFTRGCLFFFLFLLMSGCTSQYYAQYSVKTSIGEFDLYKINQLQGNVLKTKAYGAPNIALNVQRFEQGKDILYSIVIHYSGREWLLIEPGESLIFNIAGEEIILRGKGSGLERNVYYKGVVSEIAYYDIRPEFLKKIYKAKKVELKVIGENTIEERFLSKRNKKNIKQFYLEYVH